MAIPAAIIGTLKVLVTECWLSYDEQAAWETAPLVSILNQVIHFGERAVIDDIKYLRAFGVPGMRATAGEVWRYLAAQVLVPEPEMDKASGKRLTSSCTGVRYPGALQTPWGMTTPGNIFEQFTEGYATA